MGTFIQDLRFGLRVLAKNPGFVAMAVLTLALGIGVNTAIFSAVNGLFLRPLPVEKPDQLIGLAIEQKGNPSLANFSYPDFQDFRREASDSCEMLAYRVGIDGLSDGPLADRIVTSYVTGNFFTMLGLKPALGRLIQPTEGNIPGSDAVMVLDYGYWQDRFGGDPGVVGKRVRVDGQPVAIVGVAPRGFHGLLGVMGMQAYLPMNMATIEGLTAETWTHRERRSFFVLARLKSDVSLERARASFTVIAARLSQQFPKEDRNIMLRAFPEREARITPTPQPHEHEMELMAAGLFLALALLVLLLACFNVANILLVRATLRGREMSLRVALGAARHRIVRQLLTESLLLAFLGGVAGIVSGAWGSTLLGSINPQFGLPVHFDFSFDWRALAYGLAAAVLTGVVAGTLPALRAARANPGDVLHEGGRSVTDRRHRLRNALVAAQVAGSVVLLAVAGLLVRSLEKAQDIDLGFNPHSVLTLRMDPQEIGYDDARGEKFYKELLHRIRELSSVQSVSLARTYPMGAYWLNASIYVEGLVTAPDQTPPNVAYNSVSAEFFKTLEIPMVEGRAFTDTDQADTLRVAIINQTMAQRFWRHEDPIGKRFRLNSESAPWVQVVGVARDGKYRSLFDKTPPYFYLPRTQDYSSPEALVIRASGTPESMVHEIEQQAHSLASGLPLFDVRTLDEALNGPTGFFPFRMGAILAATLGLLGLILAVVGVYGVVSYVTSRRTHEIGIRNALGARRRDILTMVIGQGLSVVIPGVAAGLLGAYGLARVMEHFLYGVSPHDSITFVAVTVLLLLVALAACYFPARRATKVDPMVALRYE
jgi:predicted permease